MIYRHGDLLIKSYKPTGKLKKIGSFNSFVLAEGETTGHRHLITAEPKTKFNVYQNENGQYVLELESGVELTHEEHNKINILPDMYVVGNEQEYNYFALESQKVQD
jgi:hypothetical protein